jgi:hypothetical protein
MAKYRKTGARTFWPPWVGVLVMKVEPEPKLRRHQTASVVYRSWRQLDLLVDVSDADLEECADAERLNKRGLPGWREAVVRRARRNGLALEVDDLTC